MTKLIELTQGMMAAVDDEDYDALNKYNWQAHFGYMRGNIPVYYAVRKNNQRKTIRMHRQILGLEYGDGKIVDHANGNTLDNRKLNLSIVTTEGNSHNRKININNTSGHTGVSWCNTREKWVAYIRANDKRITLGRYDHIQDAIQARLDGEEEHWSNNERSQ